MTYALAAIKLPTATATKNNNITTNTKVKWGIHSNWPTMMEQSQVRGAARDLVSEFGLEHAEQSLARQSETGAMSRARAIIKTKLALNKQNQIVDGGVDLSLICSHLS